MIKTGLDMKNRQFVNTKPGLTLSDFRFFVERQKKLEAEAKVESNTENSDKMVKDTLKACLASKRNPQRR